MLGIIGGTGFSALPGVEVTDQVWSNTPFGETSGPIVYADYQGVGLCFLARHGNPHRISPHLINYRANLYALKQAGVDRLIAINAVGGIHPEMGPGRIAVPDQIIDYTYGRDHSIYDGVHCEVVDHIDFTQPYTQSLRQRILSYGESLPEAVLSQATYGATQGPRLESAAEILRCKRDGCDMVGMTGMPEASLARELELDYACIALSANWAAGLSEGPITMDEIRTAISEGSNKVIELIFPNIEQL